MGKILLASHNPGKTAEFRTMLGPLGWEVLSLADFPGAPIPEETGETFEENAVIKAKAARLHAGILSLADDSGLAVEALGGAPGVFSARFAGAGADALANNRLLLEKLAGLPPTGRRASFICVLALASPAGWLKVFRGETQGLILTEPRGRGGFGYDPLFLSDDLGVAFAEAEAGAKNRVSHRGRALVALAAELSTCSGWGEHL